MRIALAILVIAGVTAVVALADYPPVIRTLVFVYACGLLIGTLDEAVTSALQGQEKISRQNVGAAVNKIFFSVLMIGMVLHKAKLWMLAAAVGTANVVSLSVNLLAFRGMLGTLRWPTWTAMQGLASRGMPFMGWIVFLTLYGQIDPIVLHHVCGSATVGWYAAGFRLIKTTLFLPTAVTVALLPTLSRLHQEDPDRFPELARRMLGLVMLCGVPIALVCIAIPERLIALLHYPASFHNSIPVLRIGGFGVLLWFAANVVGTVVIASDGQSKMLRAAMAATFIGVPLCILCSYFGKAAIGNGAVGAISSDVTVELFLICCYLRMLPRGTFGRDNLVLIGKSIAAAGPMAFVLWYLAPKWGFWAAAPGILVYGLLCLALGCVRKNDLAMLGLALKRKAGQPPDDPGPPDVPGPMRETEDAAEEKTEVGAGR
jgi:O-antigen/teichoic acid export membrane protein